MFGLSAFSSAGPRDLLFAGNRTGYYLTHFPIFDICPPSCHVPSYNIEDGSARSEVLLVLKRFPARSLRVSWMQKPRDEVTLVYHAPLRPAPFFEFFRDSSIGG